MAGEKFSFREERRFCGRIEIIHIGTLESAGELKSKHGLDYVVVDGQRVIFNLGSAVASPKRYSFPKDRGRLIGFEFPQGHRQEITEYNGREVEVFARAGVTGNEKDSQDLTLYGSREYYVKLKEV